MEKWLAVASVGLTVILGWTVRDAAVQEWKSYQRTYHRMALLQAQNDAQREWARSQLLEIQQLQPKDLGTVERCTTCHLAVDNPTFRQAPEPFRQHSSLLETHPPERFGCVLCHGGEARAVTTLEAHGQGNIPSKPLLRGEYIQAACYKCHGSQSLPPEATAAVLRGRQLMNRSLCLGCHQINGEGGEEGPELSEVGSQRNWLWLYAHLARPQAVTVGSTMPVFALPRDEIRDISIYLMTLLDRRDQTRNTLLQPKRVAKSYRPEWRTKGEIAEAGAGAARTFQYDGRTLFNGLGCSLCHSIGRTGGEVGPALTHIGRKRSAEDLERLLRDPEEVLPGGKMPQLYLNAAQIKALVTYLSSLQ